MSRTDLRGRTPLHEACTDGGHLEIVRCSLVRDLYRLMIHTSKTKKTRLLLARGASSRVVDAFGNTPLHTLLASRRISSLELVPQLLRAGAPPNHSNHSGLTPLHLACMHGHVTALPDLIQAGADVNAAGTHGSPLSLCVWHGKASLIQPLLDAGASLHTECLLHRVLGKPYQGAHYESSTIHRANSFRRD